MKNFNRGGGPRSNAFGREQKQMHDAVCDNCGKHCKVPFKPTSGKPIYCSDCFEKVGGGNDRGDRNDRRGDRRDRGRDSFGGGTRQMFDAVCDNCGRDCKVPFQPTSNKPIYCSDCFEDKENGRDFGRDRGEKRNSKPQFDNNNIKAELSGLHSKLDQLNKMITSLTKEISELKPKTKKSSTKAEKETVKKELVKKTAKEVAKKEAKKAAKKPAKAKKATKKK